MERAQKEAIVRDLEKKRMVLLAGPRQAGKTTLAKEIGESYENTVYLNYDSSQDRRIIQSEGWLASTDLLILDELHKMPDWKNYLKGVFDTKADRLRILVTGSARLEVFNQVGDSLAGRYFAHRLLPLSPAELAAVGAEVDIDHFLERGSFPEPFLDPSSTDAQRWRRQYVDTLLREDVLDFDQIQNVRTIRLIFEMLRERVGSPVSYSSIAEDVQVSVNTVKKYISILEALYIVFRITPYSNNIARSILKEPKIYFFDTGLVKNDDGARFENLVAVCLLKHVYGLVDYQAQEWALHYLRTKDKQEVDFALIQDGEVQQIVEVKTTDHSIAKPLRQFHHRYGFPAVQVVRRPKREYVEAGVQLMAARSYLNQLFL